MIQLALRSSIQAEVPLRVGQVVEDRRQRDGRDQQLHAGEEDPGPEDGEQHERGPAIHRPECSRGTAIRARGPLTPVGDARRLEP